MSQKWPQSLLAMGLIFAFFPLLVAAAAKLWIKDQDFAFGLVVSSLAPCALVNPFFARIRGGDASLSLFNVIQTTLICPFITIPLLHILGFSSVYLDLKYTVYFLGSLTVFPLLLSFLTARLWPRLPQLILPSLPLLNSLVLALLMFLLVGSSLNKIPVRLLVETDFPMMILFFLVADFGFYFAVRYSARLFTTPSMSETLALSVSSRNFAVSASLMLFFHPKAAVPSAIGLMIHALFFQWLLWRKKSVPAAIALIAGLAALGPLSAEAQSAIKICLPTYNDEIGFAHILEAQSLGYFQRAELTVEILFNHDNILRALATGECDVSIISPDHLLSSSLKDLRRTVPIVELITAKQQGSRIFVLKSSKISTLNELDGQKVRIAGRHDLRTLTQLVKGAHAVTGVSAMDIEAALKSGRVAAAFAPDPLAALLISSGKFRQIGRPSDLNENAPMLRQRVLIVTSLNLKNRSPESLPSLRRAIGEVFTYLERNPSRQVSILKKNAAILGIGEISADRIAIEGSHRHMGQLTFDSLIPGKSKVDRDNRLKQWRDYLTLLSDEQEKVKTEPIMAWLALF